MDVSKTIHKAIVGSMIDFRGVSLPFGYLRVDNSLLLKSDYPRLYEAIGDTFALLGDSDATKFRLPASEDRMTLGSGGTYPIGNKGGVSDVTLTDTQIPSHTHTQNSHTHQTYQYSVYQGGVGVATRVVSGIANIGTTTATNQNTGGGLSHTNIMPSIYCGKLIKF